MAQNVNLLFASPDAIGKLPSATLAALAASLATLGIAVVNVDSSVDSGAQVEEVSSKSRIIGYLGQSQKDINGLAATTKHGGLALVVDGPASLWASSAEGRSFQFGQCRDVRTSTDVIQAVQAAIGGF
jgi:hypothetical protein